MTTSEVVPQALASLMEGSAAGTLDPAHIKSVMIRYGEMLSRGDLEGVVAIYTPDAVVRDPIVVPAYEGHAAIRGFYKGSIDSMPDLKMWVDGEVRVAGNHGAAAYIAEATTEAGRVRIYTLDVMHFNAAGLVTGMEAYWGPSNLVVTETGDAPR
jgi:steroid delta-isomerase